MNDGFDAGENSEPDRSLEDAVRRIFDDLSREEFGEPVDVFAVTRDDELLDWLGAASLDAEPAPPPAQDPADAELIEMLLAWRRSVTTDASELVPPRLAEGADAPGRPHTGRRRRVPVVSVVLAVLMVCVGLGLTVQDAMPGDPLWGVSKALNSGRAASIETSAQTRRYLDVAHTELVLGHRAAAAAALAAAQQEIAQMRSDDAKRELQARHRELANQLNRATPAPGQVSDSGAATPPSRRRDDSATSVRADEPQPRPSRSPFPHAAAAPAGTPSTTAESSMSDEPETRTPHSSAGSSDTPRPSRSATELSDSAAAVAGSHVEPSRDSEHPPSDRPKNDGDTAPAVSSGSTQPPPPTSGAPSLGTAGRAADAASDSRYERHGESSPQASTTDTQSKSSSQSTANPASSASSSPESSAPARRAHPAAHSEPTSTSAIEAGQTAPPKDKDKTAREPRRISLPTATPNPAHSRTSDAPDTSANRAPDHNSKAATVTGDSSGQPSSATSHSSDEEPSSPGSAARPANHDPTPATGTSAPTGGKHRDDREQR